MVKFSKKPRKDTTLFGIMQIFSKIIFLFQKKALTLQPTYILDNYRSYRKLNHQILNMHAYRRIPMLIIGFVLSLSVLAAEENVQPKKSLLPDYSQKIGFTYGVGAGIVSNYIWRGLYVGGLGVQADANIGYGGLFLDMWWNFSACDWTFSKNGFNVPSNTLAPGFNAELDMTIGFSRWGLTVMFMHMYYFDRERNADGSLANTSRYFDFGNKLAGGITQEWRIKYRVSDQLPLSILWCTRTFGRDGYMVDASGTQISATQYYNLDAQAQGACTLKRAYSSYLELGYDIYMPKNLCLEARVGLTPWKSLYTGMQGDFAVCNVSAKLNWHKSISEHCLMTAFANLMINPYDMATDYSINSSRNPFLWNIGCGFYLK